MYNGYTYELPKHQQDANELRTLIDFASTGNRYWVNRLQAKLEQRIKEREQAEKEQDNGSAE